MIRNYTASGPTPHHCLPQNRIPPSTFPPSQTNIPPFCSQRAPSIITTGTLMIIARPNPIQPTPPNQHIPFEKSDLIPHTGSSTNLKPTYRSLLLRTSWSLTPCPTHSSSTLQKSGIPNHMVFAPNSGRTKPRVRIPALRQLHAPNHMATLNQSTAISFYKRTPQYLIWLKHSTFK